MTLIARAHDLWQRASGPIDETRWRLWRRRLSGAALALGGVFAVQTALVHEPGYLIGALYHERRALTVELHDMTPLQRAKLLERLCLASKLLESGATDPYLIPGAEQCFRSAAPPPGQD